MAGVIRSVLIRIAVDGSQGAQRTSAQNSLAYQAQAGFTAEISKLTRQQAHLTAMNNLERRVERGARNGIQGRNRAATTKSKAKGR